MTDKRRGILNISVAIVLKLAILLSSLFARRFVIQLIGNEANGLDSLYASILGFLAVAELGIGTAITFCMYKPIVDGDTKKITALFWLFRKMYIIIGGIIAVGGLAVMPALPYLAKDYAAFDVNIYFTFGLMLISVVLSYAFSAEISLFNAYKNNYIATAIQSGGLILQYVLQIIVLFFTRSFVWYLSCRIIAIAVQWVITQIIAHGKYGSIISDKQKVDAETKKEVVKNIKAMFMHKVGNVLVNTADSIIISAFIGVVLLGKYSNYIIIMTAMTGTITLFFSPLTSIIGHLFIKEGIGTAHKYYQFFYTFNFLIGAIFFLGYYAVIDNLISICFGGGLGLIKAVSFIITLNYFIQFMRQSTLVFRDASGTFYNDRWKPLFEGLLNIGLSIGCVYLFGYLWGEEQAVVGVIVATIITNLTICHVVEPYVLHKHAFHLSPKKYYVRNYICMAVFAATLIALHYAMIQNDNQWIELFANGGISLGFSFGISAIVILCNKNFRQHLVAFFKRLRRRSDRTATEENKNNDIGENIGVYMQNNEIIPDNVEQNSIKEAVDVCAYRGAVVAEGETTEYATDQAENDPEQNGSGKIRGDD